MLYDSEKHDRRSIRLRGYDYARPGAYFVTVCVQDHVCLFGEVAEERICPNAAGKMIDAVWHDLPDHYPDVGLDAFVVMPNHIHGIIVLTGDSDPAGPSDPTDPMESTVGASPRGCPPDGRARGPTGRAQGPAPTTRMSLPDVVHRFKSLTTARYRHGVYQNGWPPFPGRLWQRNYYEHVVRGRRDLERIRRYIAENPVRWYFDRYHPDHTS